jgi:hypothetical protein
MPFSANNSSTTALVAHRWTIFERRFWRVRVVTFGLVKVPQKQGENEWQNWKLVEFWEGETMDGQQVTQVLINYANLSC